MFGSSETSARIEMVYRDCLDQLAFLKRQQWIIVGYAIAAHAALFTVAHQAKIAHDKKLVFVVFAIAATVYGIFILRGFNKGMGKFRGRLDWIYAAHFSMAEQEGLKLGLKRSPQSELPFLWGLSLTLVVSAVVTVIGILEL